MQLWKLGLPIFWISLHIFLQNKVGLNLLSMAHLSVEAESDSEHFQFLTRHCYRKLGLSIEVELLSEPRPGLISSPKSKFRDLDQYFWLGETLGRSNPSLTLSWKNPKY